jgi:hypothetical protein
LAGNKLVHDSDGPHFGLSHDYDHFILGFAPTLWALIAALMLDVPGACAYIAKQNHSVLHALSGAELFYSALTALWLLHLAAVGNIPESFELARNHINDRGGINSKLLHYPPGYFNLEEPSKTPWVYELEDNAGDVPSFEDFRTTFLSQQWIARFNLFSTTIHMLLEDSDYSMFGTTLLGNLYGGRG